MYLNGTMHFGVRRKQRRGWRRPPPANTAHAYSHVTDDRPTIERDIRRRTITHKARIRQRCVVKPRRCGLAEGRGGTKPASAASPEKTDRARAKAAGLITVPGRGDLFTPRAVLLPDCCMACPENQCHPEQGTTPAVRRQPKMHRECKKSLAFIAHHCATTGLQHHPEQLRGCAGAALFRIFAFSLSSITPRRVLRARWGPS